MPLENGAKTQLQKGQAGHEARLDLLEQGMEEVGELAQRIAALEALAGSTAPAASFWNSANGRWLIGGITITLLALLGWSADDVMTFLSGRIGD